MQCERARNNFLIEQAAPPDGLFRRHRRTRNKCGLHLCRWSRHFTRSHRECVNALFAADWADNWRRIDSEFFVLHLYKVALDLFRSKLDYTITSTL